MVFILLLLGLVTATVFVYCNYDYLVEQPDEECENCHGYGCVICHDTGCRPKQDLNDKA